MGSSKLVLFLGLHSEPFGPSPAAIVLSSAIKNSELRDRVEVQFTDFIVGPTPLDQVLWQLLDRQPDVVAIPAYSWNIGACDLLIRSLRTAAPGMSIVAGGAGLGLLPQSTRDQLDLAVAGFGEEPLVSWLAGGDCELTLTELLQSTRPYSERGDTYVASFSSKSIICYDASRGCPFRCAFCFDGSPSRPAIRRPPAIIASELSALATYGYETIDIADNNANQNSETFLAYIRAATDHPRSRFHIECRPEFFNHDQCSALTPRANVQAYLGLQSAFAEELAPVHRRNAMAQLRTVMLEWLVPAERRCLIGVDLIYGLPRQTLRGFYGSFDVAASLLPDRLNLNHYQAYRYSSNEYDTTITEGVLPNAMSCKLAWRDGLALDDTLSFIRFKHVFQQLQRCDLWTSAVIVCLLAAKRSPSEFFAELGRRVPLGSTLPMIARTASVAVTEFLDSTTSSFLLSLLKHSRYSRDLFPLMRQRPAALALSRGAAPHVITYTGAHPERIHDHLS